MRVLMLVPNLRIANGVASFVMNYLRNVDHDAVRVDIAAYGRGESPYYAEVEAFGGKVYFLPDVKNLPSHIKACRRILHEGQYDVVHDNTLHISLPMMRCAKQVGVSVRILHSHSSKMGETAVKNLRNSALRPVLCASATEYLACSRLAGRTLFGKRAFTVLPNVIQTEKYRFDEAVRDSVREKVHAADKLVVGTVGRLADQKNPFFAIDVFEALLKQVPNAEYWWVGSGNLEQRVRRYVREKGLSEQVRLLGSRNDVVDLYCAMDVFFLPSLFEGLPVTGVEAQAMGLPTVASDTVTREMVYTDLVDYVSLSETAAVWAAHLKNALDRRADRGDCSERLRQSVFSDTGCGERLRKMYERFLKKAE